MNGHAAGVLKPEHAFAWELRAEWTRRRDVRVTLTDRCMLRTVVGRVSYVAVTGAFAVIDGWHLPMSEVLSVGKPTHEDRDRYAAIRAERIATAGGSSAESRTAR